MKQGKKPSKQPVKSIRRNEHGQIVKGSGPLNPAGRASEGESWAATFKRVFNMTPKEAAKFAGEIGKRLELYGAKQTTLKELIAYRLADALLFDPSAGLLTAVMDRAEGKLAQVIGAVDWREEVRRYGYDPAEVFETIAQAASARLARADHGGSLDRSDPAEG